MSKKPPKPAAAPAVPIESAAPDVTPPEPPADETPDQVLATAAATAQPDAEPPVVEPQPPDADLVIGQPPFEPEYPPIAPVYRLEDARALPEITGSVFVAHVCDDPRAIGAFRDEDGRTMQVAVTVDGLAKIELTQGAPA